MTGLNSHDFGIEQIFIRTHLNDPSLWWEVTITSFERMVEAADTDGSLSQNEARVDRL